MERRRPPIVGQVLSRSASRLILKPEMSFISSGSILANLALSQRGRDGGWARGYIGNIVGDGATGKTIMALEACASAILLGVHPVYNNVEGKMDFPLEDMYGPNFRSSVEWIRSETVEAMGADLHHRLLHLKEPILWILDSVDSMVSEAGKKRAEKKANGKSRGASDDEEGDGGNKKNKGTYGTEKAKYFSSEFFNNLCNMMEGRDATLLFISQVRENLKAGLFGKKYYRTGGKGFDFYTHQVGWLYHTEKLEREVRKHKRSYGVGARLYIDRNKVAPPYRGAEFPIIFDRGIGDEEAMCDYLKIDNAKEILAEIDAEIRRGMPRAEIQCYNDLCQMLEEEWKAEEEAIKSERPPKYQI